MANRHSQLKSAADLWSPSLSGAVLASQLERGKELRSEFYRGLGLEEDSPQADLVTGRFLELAAPSLAPVSEELVSKLQQAQEERHSGPCCRQVAIQLKRNPLAELDVVRQRVLNLQPEPSRRGANDLGWKNFIVFRYLSDIAFGYRAVLVDVAGNNSSAPLEIKLHVGLFDSLPANVGIRFETHRFRYFLAVKQLMQKGLPPFPGRRIESDAIGFFSRVYGHLKDAGVLYLPEFRKCDDRLLKAIYKQCQAEGRDPELVLPPRRTDVTTYNAEGTSRVLRNSIAAVTQRVRRRNRLQVVPH